MLDARDISLSILMDIESGTFSNNALAKGLRQNQFSEKKDRAFITRLVEGVVERKLTLDYIINQFSKTKINKCKPLIRCLIRMGVYQIIYMDFVPDSAACNECVKLAKKHGFANLSGFVNGVLRNIVRNKNEIKYPTRNDGLIYYSVKYSMPEWICEKLVKDYGDDTEKILESSFTERKTSIRVNELKITKEELKDMLQAAGISVYDGLYDDKALLIDNYDFIRKIPGFKKGYFTVQDESSMCAIRACNIKPGDTVIDVCSAPGGKTTAAAEYLCKKGRIYSRDISLDKLELIEENVNRIGVFVSRDGEYDNDDNNKCIVDIACHDALIKEEKLVLRGDVVIADLPCSGMGIIGRKNDIKYRITKEQLQELVKLQRNILDVVKAYVKRGGTLLFSTCTINPDENEKNIGWFLEKNKDFTLEASRLFVQGREKCDGFYYSVLKRK